MQNINGSNGPSSAMRNSNVVMFCNKNKQHLRPTNNTFWVGDYMACTVCDNRPCPYGRIQTLEVWREEWLIFRWSSSWSATHLCLSWVHPHCINTMRLFLAKTLRGRWIIFMTYFEHHEAPTPQNVTALFYRKPYCCPLHYLCVKHCAPYTKISFYPYL